METSAHTQTAPASPTRGTAGRRIAISLAVLIAAINIIGGAALITVHLVVRDDDGYYATDSEQFETEGGAIVVEDIDLSGQRGDLDIEDLSAAVRLEVESSTPEPVFVGIATREDAESYLAGSGYTAVNDFGDGPPVYEQVDGPSRLARPLSQDIWAAESYGSGQRSVEWDAEAGEWTAIAMNADASPGLRVDAAAGIGIGWLHWVGLGLIVFGGLIAATTWLVARGTRRSS